MRVHGETLDAEPGPETGDVEKHERLQQFAQVTRADEPRDRPMGAPARTVDDGAGLDFRGLERLGSFGDMGEGQ